MKRNSRIELFRILCILGITAHHLVFHSDVMEQPFGITRAFAQFFIMFGKSGVNIFVLISGYYLAGNEAINYRTSFRRALKSWKQVIVYSILLGVGSILLFRDSLSASRLLKTVFPVTTGAYWFMTAFIGLMIVEPFLNQFVHKLEQDDYKKIIILGFLMFVLLPINTWCNDFLWFIYLYIIAGYIRLHKLQWLTTQSRRLAVGVGCFVLIWLASVILSLVSSKIPAVLPYINYFSLRQNSIPMFLGSVGLFLWVLNMKPIRSEIINRIAKHVLPCYLIQSNVFWSSRLWGCVDSIIPKDGLLYPVCVLAMVIILVSCFMLIDVVVVVIEKGIISVIKRNDQKCLS